MSIVGAGAMIGSGPVSNLGRKEMKHVESVQVCRAAGGRGRQTRERHIDPDVMKDVLRELDRHM